MKAELIIYNISKLYTPSLNPPVKGNSMSQIKVISNCIQIKRKYFRRGGFKNYTIFHIFDANRKFAFLAS